jgi:hypothetical protein
MQTNEVASESKMRRTVGDLVVAEMFLIQATIESANVIGSGLAELGKQFATADADAERPEPIKSVIQRTRDEVVDSYTSRFNYLRKMIDGDS